MGDMLLSRRTAAALLVVSAVALAGCASPTPVPTPESAESEAATILTSVVASGLDAPWSIAFHGETALVSERDSARIVEITATGGAREVGRIEGVRAGGEGGLLGIAVHEDQLYTYLTADAGDGGASDTNLVDLTGGLTAPDPRELEFQRVAVSDGVCGDLSQWGLGQFGSVGEEQLPDSRRVNGCDQCPFTTEFVVGIAIDEPNSVFCKRREVDAEP